MRAAFVTRIVTSGVMRVPRRAIRLANVAPDAGFSSASCGRLVAHWSQLPMFDDGEVSFVMAAPAGGRQQTACRQRRVAGAVVGTVVASKKRRHRPGAISDSAIRQTLRRRFRRHRAPHIYGRCRPPINAKQMGRYTLLMIRRASRSDSRKRFVNGSGRLGGPHKEQRSVRSVQAPEEKNGKTDSSAPHAGSRSAP
jgi:hypothetical protein